MSSRKKEMAEKLKEKRKTNYYAILRNCPTSPTKMRLVADLIRGQEVHKALGILKFTKKEAAGRLEKLLSSAIANYEAKSGNRADTGNLVITKIQVDGGFILKRLRTAPQGRAHRIRKRSNHVTLFVDTVETSEKE
jgi:large subunit ribosomal protein L22